MTTDNSSTQDKSDVVKDKNVGGRPTLYSDELARKICDLIEDGNSLRKICEEVEGMPNRSSVNKWLSENKEFSDQYARSCIVRRENRFDNIYNIALTTEDVSRARLLVDVVKWQLSKEEPKKYGDKLDIDARVEQVTPILGGKAKEK